MKATHFEFRFRFLIHAILFVLGFLAPWNYWLHLNGRGIDTNKHVWGTLAMSLGRGSGAAFNILLIIAIAFAVAAALLRVAGAAYMGSGVVHSAAMHGEAVVVDGPYRHLRNPLYLGIFFNACALALLMPPSGAIFAIVTIGFFELRLTFGEEAFLAAKLGEPYLAYCARVPRIFPSLMPRVAASGRRPQWWLAIAGEIYMIGVALSYAVLGWRYDASLLARCVIISLGVAIVMRALLPRVPQTA